MKIHKIPEPVPLYRTASKNVPISRLMQTLQYYKDSGYNHVFAKKVAVIEGETIYWVYARKFFQDQK